ncbi:MAG: DEAD/DEAH box helicase, partial [Halobacteriales archaeon]
MESAYVDHELLADGVVERRMYQLELSSAALEESSLVVLPTGAGKTTVALLVTAARLSRLGGRSLFLAPTKPLVEQHVGFYREALDFDDPETEVRLFTGDTRPDERERQWEDARVVVATPQVVENDVIAGRISLDDVVHLTFDECHRASG